MLGHELRNPLGAISTALFLLQEGPADRAAQKGTLEVATRQARHMEQMLDDLLDLARINEGTILLQRTRLDLGIEVQQALEVAQVLFNLRKHVVLVSQPVERIYVMAACVTTASASGPSTAERVRPVQAGPSESGPCRGRLGPRAHDCAAFDRAARRPGGGKE